MDCSKRNSLFPRPVEQRKSVLLIKQNIIKILAELHKLLVSIDSRGVMVVSLGSAHGQEVASSTPGTSKVFSRDPAFLKSVQSTKRKNGGKYFFQRLWKLLETK